MIETETLRRPPSWQVWVLAARPKTLPAAIVPVIVGTALAVRIGAWSAVPALLCLGFALSVQIAANFANDYYDYIKGADTPERTGPARAVAAGWVRPERMRNALFLTLGLAFVIGLGLVPYGGWPLVIVGIACLVSAVAYTAGPFPIGYVGLGDVFVILFFGFIGVGFTFFVQAGYFDWSAWLAGAGVGAVTANILVVNNCRDWETDRRVGKKTLVARFGPDFGYCQYFAQFALAFAVPFVLLTLGFGYPVLLPLVLALWALNLFRRVVRAANGAQYNRLLAETALFVAAYGALLSAGLLL